jgi:hypothetical protein
MRGRYIIHQCLFDAIIQCLDKNKLQQTMNNNLELGLWSVLSLPEEKECL